MAKPINIRVYEPHQKKKRRRAITSTYFFPCQPKRRWRWNIEDDKVLRRQRQREYGRAWRKRQKEKYLSGYERKLVFLIKKFKLPYKFVGNGGFILGGKRPDFLNVNGEKVLIETYCRFWHSPHRSKYTDYEKERGTFFNQFGFKTLFLNEDDIERKDWEQHCLMKIKKFDGSIT